MPQIEESIEINEPINTDKSDKSDKTETELKQQNEKYKSRLNDLNQRISNLEQSTKPSSGVVNIPPPAIVTPPQQFMGGSANRKQGGFLQYGAGNKSKKLNKIIKSIHKKKLKNRSKHRNKYVIWFFYKTLLYKYYFLLFFQIQNYYNIILIYL